MADRAAYQYLPTAVLADQKRAEEAAAWAQKERTALAARWAEMHEQNAYDVLGPLLQQQTTQDAQQTAYEPDSASWGSPSMEGAYQPSTPPVAPTMDPWGGDAGGLGGFDLGKAIGSSGMDLAPSGEVAVSPVGGPTGTPSDPVSATLAYLGITKPGEAAPDPELIQQQGPEPPPFLPPMLSPGGGLMMPPPIQAGHKPPPSQETQGEVLAGDPNWEKLGLRETGEMLGAQLQTSPAVAQDMPGLRIGRSEQSGARAFAQGLTETSGAGGGGGAVRAAGEVGGTGDALGGALDDVAEVATRARAPGRTTPLSPPAQRVADAYQRLTPERVPQIRQFTTEIATSEFPQQRHAWSTPEYWDEVQRAGADLHERAKMVVTQLNPAALTDFLESGQLRSKFDALSGDDVVAATRRSVAVDGKRATGDAAATAYGDAQARHFVDKEAGADDRMFGATNYEPLRGPNSFGRMYGSVTDGQALVNERRPTGTVVLVMDPQTTPRVSVLHHHYAFAEPFEDIHVKATPENLQSTLWEEMPGGRLDIGEGQRVLDTPWAVGPEGESALRVSNLIQTMPTEVRAVLENTEQPIPPADLAAMLMRGQARRDQPVKAGVNAARVKAGMAKAPPSDQTDVYAAATNANRSETMLIEPSVDDVTAIYISGTPGGLDLVDDVPFKWGGRNRSANEAATFVQAKIKELTGREVPIVKKLMTPGGPKTIDASLSPGRGEVVERYTGRGLTNLGAGAGVTAEQNEQGETEFGFDPVRGALGVGAGSLLRRGKRPGAATAKAATRELERLRLDKFPEGVRDSIEEAATEGDFWRTQRRGVVSDEKAERLADQMGRTVDQVIAKSAVGKSYNTEETRALRNALVAQSVKVADLAQQAAEAPAQVTREFVAKQIAEGMKLADLSRIAEGARAEAGRTLRAYQTFTRDYANDPAAAVVRIFKAVGLDEGQAMAKVDEFAKMTAQGADPFQMANFWARTENPPVVLADWFRALRYNAMLSGPRTLLVNVIGGGAELPWRGLRDVGASVVTGRPGALKPEIEGAFAGLTKGIAGARDIIAHGITREQAAAGDVPRSLSARLQNPAGRAAATALESTGRVLGATDEIVRQVAYGMAVGRAAGIKAHKEGVRGAAWLARVDELVKDADKETVEGALAVADRTTFKGEMGDLGEKALLPLQAWTPYGVPVGNIIIPFLRTVVHITQRGLDTTPLGAIGAAADTARGVYGPRTAKNLAAQLGDTVGPGKGVAPLGERLGDSLMGSVAMAGLGLAAANGDISGAGPEDPEKRKLMMADGWQPYSVRVAGNWVSYANWGRFAIPLSFAAAAVESDKYKKPDDTTIAELYDGFTRGAKVLTEQAYLQGVGAIFKALDPAQGQRYGEQMLEQTLATLVPFGSALNTIGQATDTVVRAPEKGDVVGALQARIPGLREQLPAKQDVMGRDVANPQRGLGAAQPLRISPEKNDTVVRALLDAGVDVPEPPKTVSDGAVRNLPLTQAEQRDYRRIQGEKLSGFVSAYLSGKGKSDDPERRAATLKAYLEAARTAAEGEILKAMGNDQIRERMKKVKPAA